jgi:acetyltransferase-like isoleucine patch superfamily enzyme/acyl carrier protein
VVRNAGTLAIGDDVLIQATPATTHLVTAPTGVLQLGDRVEIGQGGAISCHAMVDIQDDVVVGPYVAIMDFDYHAAGGHAPAPRPVTVGPGVRLGARCIVLPGSQIGAGAVVQAGSVVAGSVAPGARVAGNPAMAPPSGTQPSDLEVDGAEIVQRVFGLEARPTASDGRDSIPTWDSLGALELLVALEAVVGRPLDEAVLARLRTVDDVERLLADVGRPAPVGAAPGSVAVVVAGVFGLRQPPAGTTRRVDIPGWDSLGTLELMLALEQSFGVVIDERMLAHVQTVRDLELLLR